MFRDGAAVAHGCFGAVWTQAEAGKVLWIIGAEVIEHELPVPLGCQSIDGELDPGAA